MGACGARSAPRGRYLVTSRPAFWGLVRSKPRWSISKMKRRGTNNGSDRLESPEFTPPPRKVQGWWPPDSGCIFAILCAIATLAIVLVLLDWLLNTAQP
jgi:hypothetical protein